MTEEKRRKWETANSTRKKKIFFIRTKSYFMIQCNQQSNAYPIYFAIKGCYTQLMSRDASEPNNKHTKL